MNAKTRRKLEMGSRALEFSRAHPDESAGYTAAVAQLEEQLARSRQLAAQQQKGTAEVHAASERKRDLRRSIRRSQLIHLARVARRAAREMPELAQKFALAPDPTPYLVFRTMADRMLAEAQQQKDLLLKHGLHERVLGSLQQSLGWFDQALEQGAQGRRTHVGASVELDAVADEIVQIVKLIDGLNRFRFAQDTDLLAAWTSASNVIGPPRPASQPAEGEIKPAA